MVFLLFVKFLPCFDFYGWHNSNFDLEHTCLTIAVSRMASGIYILTIYLTCDRVGNSALCFVQSDWIAQFSFGICVVYCDNDSSGLYMLQGYFSSLLELDDAALIRV